jgi:hypothetical protein
VHPQLRSEFGDRIQADRGVTRGAQGLEGEGLVVVEELHHRLPSENGTERAAFRPGLLEG